MKYVFYAVWYSCWFFIGALCGNIYDQAKKTNYSAIELVRADSVIAKLRADSILQVSFCDSTINVLEAENNHLKLRNNNLSSTLSDLLWNGSVLDSVVVRIRYECLSNDSIKISEGTTRQ